MSRTGNIQKPSDIVGGFFSAIREARIGMKATMVGEDEKNRSTKFAHLCRHHRRLEAGSKKNQSWWVSHHLKTLFLSYFFGFSISCLLPSSWMCRQIKHLAFWFWSVSLVAVTMDLTYLFKKNPKRKDECRSSVQVIRMSFILHFIKSFPSERLSATLRRCSCSIICLYVTSSRALILASKGCD